MSQSAEQHADQNLGRAIKGSYRLERLLGAGGMGAVYEAVDRAGQCFAVKLIHPHIADADGAVRFVREAQVGWSIKSNHVVPVVDSGQEPSGEHFLVMPLLAGHDLAGLLERTGPIDPTLAVRLALQACDGLMAAHREGVIHRDVKPSNLFLHYLETGQAVVRVCDFGVAKCTEMYDDSQLTRTGASMGSPLYMSPEQVQSAKHVDERTDIYSLAATLYELLCGTTPHGDARSMGELMVRICTKPAPSVQDRAAWVSPELSLAVHRAMHRRADCRYESIEQFVQALVPMSGGRQQVYASELLPVGPEVASHVAVRADLSQLDTAGEPGDTASGSGLMILSSVERSPASIGSCGFSAVAAWATCTRPKRPVGSVSPSRSSLARRAGWVWISTVASCVKRAPRPVSRAQTWCRPWTRGPMSPRGCRIWSCSCCAASIWRRCLSDRVHWSPRSWCAQSSKRPAAWPRRMRKASSIGT